MIFSELYSAYYQAVAAILRQAVKAPLDGADLRRIVAEYAFSESVMAIEPALKTGQWQLLRPDGSTPLKHPPTMPLTTLQKRWLKAISLDPRVRLFGEVWPDYDVPPLFTPRDVTVYDRFSDGDPYEDEGYIARFRLILSAIKTCTPLSIDSTNRRGGLAGRVMLPRYLEYSAKDDKFRLIGTGFRAGNTVNLGRIVRCEPFTGTARSLTQPIEPPEKRTVTLQVTDQRNALERVLMHFAHFEKEAERLGEDTYQLTITYDRDDETELVIRVLSFGPMVKVTAPEHFVELIKDRLKRQLSCGL